MSTFLVDSKNDLVLTSGTFSVVGGLDGALLAAKHYAQTLHSEMIHDMTSGVRMFDTAFNQPRLALFKNELRSRLMQVPDVVSVSDIDVRVSGENLLYSATIETIYGNGRINNA